MFRNYPKIRIVTYILAVASTIAAFFVDVYNPELSNAFTLTAGVLTTLAGGTALTNVATVGTVNVNELEDEDI